MRLLADAAFEAAGHLRDGESDQDAMRTDEKISIRFGGGEDFKRSGSPVRDDLVRRSRTIEVLGERTPGHGLRVEGLDLLAGPNVRTLGVEQDLALVRDDLLHDNELQDRAHAGPEALNDKAGDWRQFGVLRHLEIAREGEALSAGVVAVKREVCRRGKGTLISSVQSLYRAAPRIQYGGGAREYPRRCKRSVVEAQC